MINCSIRNPGGDDDNRKRQRHRNVTWFNPLFSKNVRTDIGRRFLQLVAKHFPRTSELHKIFNKNTVKVSYSCLPNMANIISGHNKRLKHPPPPCPPCNCRSKIDCPLDGKCQQDSIVYKAEVTCQQSSTKKNYIGLAETPFKQRYVNHFFGMRNTHTALSYPSTYGSSNGVKAHSQ